MSRALQRILNRYRFSPVLLFGTCSLMAQTEPTVHSEKDTGSEEANFSFKLPEDGSWPFDVWKFSKSKCPAEQSLGVKEDPDTRAPILLISPVQEIKIEKYTIKKGALKFEKQSIETLWNHLNLLLKQSQVQYQTFNEAEKSIETDWFLTDLSKEKHDIEARLKFSCHQSGNDSILKVELIELRSKEFDSDSSRKLSSPLTAILPPNYTIIEHGQSLDRALCLNLRTLTEGFAEQIYGQLNLAWKQNKPNDWNPTLLNNPAGKPVIQLNVPIATVSKQIETFLKDSGFLILSSFSDSKKLQVSSEPLASKCEENTIPTFEAVISMVDCGVGTELDFDILDDTLSLEPILKELLTFFQTAEEKRKKN